MEEVIKISENVVNHWKDIIEKNIIYKWKVYTFRREVYATSMEWIIEIFFLVLGSTSEWG